MNLFNKPGSIELERKTDYIFGTAGRSRLDIGTGQWNIR